MSNKLNILNTAKCLLKDGGMGSMLMEIEAIPGTHPLWSAAAFLTDPGMVKKVHTAFLEAGADIIQTNTYHAGLPLLREQGLSQEQCNRLLDDAFNMARKAIDEYRTANPRPILLAGDIGPYAVMYHDGSEYSGAYVDKVDAESIKNYYTQQLKAIMSRGPDLITVDTVPSLREAEIVVSVLDELRLEVPTWVAVSCQSSSTTCYGDPIESLANLIAKSSAVDILGVNCTGPQHITGLLERIEATGFGKPLAVYPNSGEPWDAKIGEFLPKESAGVRDVHDYCEMWKRFNIKVIGGCCRVKPDELRKIAQSFL